ncbi:MAG: PEGA domain-containing protein, partial [Methanoregulaceae archaeon]
SGTAAISANSRQTINAALTPAATGWITIMTSPAGATIYLDNTYKGQTNSLGAMTINDVYPGLHVIKAVCSGYTGYTTTVNVDAKARTYVPIKMTVQQGASPTPQPGYSGLEITSTPSGAAVFLDNVSMGVTPLTLTSVAAGQHTLLVQKSGYQDEQILVQTTQGTIFPLDLTLGPAETPAPTKSAEVPFVVLGALAVLVIILNYKRES